jgi:nitroreductase
MDILEAIQSRKSIRCFKPEAVPKEILEKVIDAARRSPSTENTQPWEITVVAGEVIESIKKGNVEMLTSGATPEPDFSTGPYEGKYRQRQVDVGYQLYGLMGIDREDRKSRAEWWQRGFRFFDAPAALILSIDRSLKGIIPLFDVGLFAQTICLVALNYGLGTCIEMQGVMFPDVARKFARIPETKRIITSIAIGYPDWDFPENNLESNREPIDSFVTWRGFAEKVPGLQSPISIE